MVKLNKIYTRTGDDGTTGLVCGPRRAKYDLRVAAYGSVDEANSALGIAALHVEADTDLSAMLFRIQNDLFDLGADLATPDTGETLVWEPLRIVGTQVTRLETEIDQLNDTLEPLKSFVLPGGTPASAYLHLARTIARRAEREMVELAALEGEAVSSAAIQYINRLSDFLFVAARYVNHSGTDPKGDVLWVPGQNR
jgi:cob(I)alamin adenosyltransferase